MCYIAIKVSFVLSLIIFILHDEFFNGFSEELGWSYWTPVPHTVVACKHSKIYDILMQLHNAFWGADAHIEVIGVALE